MLIDAQKALDKIQHPFVIKTLRKIGIEEDLHQFGRDIYKMSTTNITRMLRDLLLCPTTGKKSGISTLTTAVPHGARSSIH